MPRIELTINANPVSAEVVCNFIRKDGGHEKIFATLDTGAETCFLPRYLMQIIEFYNAVEIELEQAGIGALAIQAVQAEVDLAFEDAKGNRTAYRRAPVWFAETEISLIGFEGVLDRAVLHLDMPARDGRMSLD